MTAHAEHMEHVEAKQSTIDPKQASLVGGRTLEIFSQTPRLNAWMYSKIAAGIGGDVLEIGSGIGNLSRHIVRDADRVVLTDIEPHYLESLRQEFAGNDRVMVERFDLYENPPPSIAARRFDAIVAVNVIEHVEDDRGLVQRLAALLKPGGRLLIYVPACPFAYGTLNRALGHFRRYTPASLAGLLQQAGLEAETPRYINLVGLLGWIVNGLALRRERLSPKQVALVERLIPVMRLEDRIRLPIGLGVHTQARKPATKPATKPTT